MKYERKFIYDNGFSKRIYLCLQCQSHRLISSHNGGFNPCEYVCEDCGKTCGSPAWESLQESFLPIREILKKVGMFASDIKIRLKNKQMKLNGVVVTGIEELDVLLEDDCIHDCGDFVFHLCMKNPLWAMKLKFIGLEEYFEDGCNIEDSLSKYLKGYKLLKVSKKQSYIIELFGKNY